MRVDIYCSDQCRVSETEVHRSSGSVDTEWITRIAPKGLLSTACLCGCSNAARRHHVECD
jgi:hypothetical protein